MRFTPNCDLNGVQPETLRGMAAAEEVSVRLGFGELVVTSVCDGPHTGAKSKHHVGLAFDCRTRHLSLENAATFALGVKERLPDARWDVIFENPDAKRRDDGEHLHCEVDPH